MDKAGRHAKRFPPTYLNTTSANWGVNRNSDTGVLSGYAYSENAGWISFNTTNSQVVVGSDGKFDGYAWSESMGWIHFQFASVNISNPAILDGKSRGDYFYLVQAENGPLVAELVSFTAEAVDGHVLLTWKTASELDTVGFHLWRSDSEAGEYARITRTLIPAGGGPALGAAYTHVDGDVTPPWTGYYKLEVMDSGGASVFHGPVSVTVGESDGICPDCSGDPCVIRDVAFPAGKSYQCDYAVSVLLGPDVTVQKGADVTIRAPKIGFRPGYHAESGAVVRIQTVGD